VGEILEVQEVLQPKHISIQGTAAIITIEPFNKNEELRLIKTLETSTD
jgi:hypothetical protein